MWNVQEAKCLMVVSHVGHCARLLRLPDIPSRHIVVSSFCVCPQCFVMDFLRSLPRMIVRVSSISSSSPLLLFFCDPLSLLLTFSPFALFPFLHLPGFLHPFTFYSFISVPFRSLCHRFLSFSCPFFLFFFASLCLMSSFLCKYSSFYFRFFCVCS